MVMALFIRRWCLCHLLSGFIESPYEMQLMFVLGLVDNVALLTVETGGAVQGLEVPSEVVLVRELPATGVTLVVLVSRVDDSVLLHVIVGLEGLAADVAAVGSLPGVEEPVPLQLHQLVEGFGAVLQWN